MKFDRRHILLLLAVIALPGAVFWWQARPGPGMGSGAGARPSSADDGVSITRAGPAPAMPAVPSSRAHSPRAGYSLHELAATPGFTLRDPAVRAKVVRLVSQRSVQDRQDAVERALREGWETRRHRGGYGSQLVAIRDNKVYELETHNANAAISTAVPEIRARAPYLVDGRGIRAGVWDEGDIRRTHREFGARVFLKDYVGSASHSTHVAGTMGASGMSYNAMGMAPLAQLNSYDWNDVTAEMLADVMVESNEVDAVQVSNHSYGYKAGWSYKDFPLRWYGVWGGGVRESDGFGQYGTDAADWDTVCFYAPYHLPFKSSGNDRSDGAPAAGTAFEYYNGGWQTKSYDPATDPLSDAQNEGGYDTITTIGNAKNAVTVGSVGDAVVGIDRDLTGATMEGYSGWGPTDDGRLKPDLVANGQGLYSPTAGSDSDYSTYSGSSMAVANASGCAVLLVQRYRDLFNAPVRNDVLKALMIHSADDLGRVGPDYQYGWGLVNVKTAADLLYSHAAWPEAGRVATHVIAGGDDLEWEVTSDGTQPLRATLCWMDPPALPALGLDNPSPRLVHDLDLAIVGPSGTVHHAFVLNPSLPAQPATAGTNVLDNVEQVLIAEAGAGTYRVHVTAPEGLAQGSQVFALIVSGNTVVPRIAHEPLQNTLQTNGTYAVSAEIVSEVGLDTNRVVLTWRVADGPAAFSTNQLAPGVSNLYHATIPAHAPGTSIEYFLSATTTNGIVSRHPSGSERHRFSVVDTEVLMINGAPVEVGGVAPPYGLNWLPSGVVVRASCDAFVPVADGERYACLGWVGVGGVPTSGSSNAVAFALSGPSALEWLWDMQVELQHSSLPADVVTGGTWWTSGSTGATFRAPERLSTNGHVYAFVGWTLDGERQPDPTSSALNPVVGIPMLSRREAQARYVDESIDEDGDGMGDWWELRHFGAIGASPYADADDDGYLNLEEFEDRSNPRESDSVPGGPLITHAPLTSPLAVPAPWTVSADVVDNSAVTGVMLRWRRNGLSWRQVPMVHEAGTDRYEAPIGAPGILRDTFEYTIQATDLGGFLVESGPHRFDVAYAQMDVGPARRPFLLLAGTSATLALGITNRGNAELDWTADVVDVGLNEDFSGESGAWWHGGPSDLWHLTTNRFASPPRAWYCGYATTQTYFPKTDAALVTPPVRVGAGGRLAFNQWLSCELDSDGVHAWDGAVIEISTDGGVHYEFLTPDGGYPYRITPNVDSPFEADTPCLAGSGGWEQITADLGAFAGREVRFRFWFGSDAAVEDTGWFIDDVVVTPTSLGAGWLTLSESNGVVSWESDAEIALHADSTGLESGTDDVVLIQVSGNAPAEPTVLVEATLRVRSRPVVTLSQASQVSTNGQGWVSFSNSVSDLDGDWCTLRVEFNEGPDAAWAAPALLRVASQAGVASISNELGNTITGITTHDLVGALLTNQLDVTWSTRDGASPIGLATGASLRVQAWDGLFWSHAVTSQPFLVDNEAPGAVSNLVITSHVAGEWVANRNLTLNWAPAADGDGVGVLDYGAFARMEGLTGSVVRTTGTQAVVSVVDDGSNWWGAVSARDAYGNEGEAVLQGPFMIDFHPPTATGAVVTASTSPYGDYVVGSNMTFTWRGFEDHHAGIDGYYFYAVDNGRTPYGFWTTSTSVTMNVLYPDQTNVIYVWARDRLGLIGAAVSGQVLALEPSSNLDGDSISNAGEELVGSDAADGSSQFELRAIGSASPAGPERMVIEWPGLTGRLYRVEQRARLGAATSSWSALSNALAIPGVQGDMTYTDRVDGAAMRFYRVTVRPEP